MARTAATLSIAMPPQSKHLRRRVEEEPRPRRAKPREPLDLGLRLPSAAMLVGSTLDLGGISPAELRPA